MYSDHLTEPHEIAELHRGVGFFADASRLCHWLSAVDGPEQQRRMAVCVMPNQYRAVLLTDEHRMAAAYLVQEQILAMEPDRGPQTVDGLLSSLSDSVSAEAHTYLLHLTSWMICDPRTCSWWRNQLVTGLIESGLSTWTYEETISACALRVLAADNVSHAIGEHAESLLHDAVSMSDHMEYMVKGDDALREQLPKHPKYPTDV